jgi:hypothetical protein
MAKLNIFISQPMNGLSEREILAERDRIEEVLRKLFPNDELTFLSGYTSEIAHFQDENQERIYRLGCSVSIMAEADYIFLPDGYMDARGCVVEARVAGEYNIPIIREIREMSSEFSCRGDEKIRDRYDISNFGGNRV